MYARKEKRSPIRVLDKCQTLHAAAIRLLYKFHSLLLKALACSIHVRHLQPDVACAYSMIYAYAKLKA